MKLYPTLKATGSAIEGINAVASGAGGSLDALSNVFSLLSTKQMSVIKNIGKLTKEQMLEVIASEALTAEQKAYIQTAWQSAQATTAQAAATDGATVATSGLTAATKGLWAVMKAHPLFMTIAGIAAVVAIFNKLNVSAKEQKAITEELQGEYQSLTSEISSLESELDGVHKRLKELDALQKKYGQYKSKLTEIATSLQAQRENIHRVTEEGAALQLVIDEVVGLACQIHVHRRCGSGCRAE